MSTKTLNILVLLVGVVQLPLWGQVEPSASGGVGMTSDDSLMTMPAAVNGGFYPTEVGSQRRSNFLSGGVIVSAAYDDNVFPGNTPHPLSAESYSVWPTISMELGTPRTQGTLIYSPGFVFYHPTSDLNQVTQSGTADFHYRLTPHTTVGVQDVFQQNSTVFSQPYTMSGATNSGSSGADLPVVILPYVGQINNSTRVETGYQFSRSSMVGMSGSYSFFNFQGSGPQLGLYDSTNTGGLAFYSRRLTPRQYLGVTYGYSQLHTTPFATTTRSQIGSIFYSVSFNNRLSLSLKGGPEFSTTDSPGVPTSSSWDPSGTVGLAWFSPRTNISFTYSRSVTTGWGLLGIYTTDTASALYQRQLTRRLVAGASGDFANLQHQMTQLTFNVATGHTIFGRATLQYQLGEHLTAVAEFGRLHENYAIGLIQNSPDADRTSVSINYSFRRPLGQ